MKKLLLFFVLLYCAVSVFAGETKGSIMVDGRTRNYLLYVPSDTSKTPKPLVFVLHGHLGTPEGTEKLCGFETVAEREKFIVVYPEGINKGWNDGRGRNADVDDVKFFAALMDYLIANNPIDARRIYSTGFSNGAFMSLRLACELGNRIAAVAGVSGNLDTAIDAHCQTTFPVSVMVIHGNKDPLVPYDGGAMNNLPGCYILSHQQLIANWVKRDKCPGTPAISIIPDTEKDGTYLIKTVYSGGNNGAEVISYVVDNGGHTWPGSNRDLLPALLGKTTHNLNATEVIWEFFKRHSK